jgi:hypothetical protein
MDDLVEPPFLETPYGELFGVLCQMIISSKWGNQRLWVHPSVGETIIFK